ncbi:MAG: hypothetical protein MZU95_13640 [Desulfomicrobium escambiense]|nr:hypothetical protein [Desulfomicrobium escambiense]
MNALLLFKSDMGDVPARCTPSCRRSSTTATPTSRSGSSSTSRLLPAAGVRPRTREASTSPRSLLTHHTLKTPGQRDRCRSTRAIRPS